MPLAKIKGLHVMDDKDQYTKVTSLRRKQVEVIITFLTFLNLIFCLFMIFPLMFIVETLVNLFYDPFSYKNIIFWVYVCTGVPIIVLFPVGIYRTWSAFSNPEYGKSIGYAVLPLILGIFLIRFTEILFSGK